MESTIQPLPPVHDDDEKQKVKVEHLEHDAPGLAPVSAYADLGFLATLKTFRRTALLCVMALFTACSDGYQYSLPGNLVAEKSFIAKFATLTSDDGPALDPQHVAIWGGVYSGGYIAALLVGGYPADYFGRRFNIALLTLFMVAACLVEMFAKDWQTWTAAKLFNGFSVGLCQLTLTTYVSELAPVQLRGGLLIVYSFWFAMGQFTNSIGVYVIQSMDTRPELYKRLVYTEWLFSGLVFMTLLILPESPPWLLRKGKREAAAKALKRLNGGIPGYDIERELQVMQLDLEGTAVAGEVEAKKTSYFDLFKGTDLRRTLISFSILGWQQTIGIPVVFGYTALFFKEAGLANPFLGTIIINIILIGTVFTSSFVVEKTGRRPMLLLGGTIMVACLTAIGGLGFASGTSVSAAIVALMCIWVLAYASSAGPMGYLFLGESSTAALRARTAGFAAAMSGVFGLIFNYTTPLMLLSDGDGAGWGIKTAFLFAGLGFIGLVLIYFFVPEHKGRSYAELDELYNRRIPAREFATTKTYLQEQAQGV